MSTLRHHRRPRMLAPQARRASVGATLIEMVLAMALLLIVLVPAAAFLIAGVRSAVSSSLRSTAISLLSAEVSKLDSALEQYYPSPQTSPNTGNNPPVCNTDPSLQGQTDVYGGAEAACGSWAMATDANGTTLLPQAETISVGSAKTAFTFTYTPQWSSSESQPPPTPANPASCGTPPTGPFPPALVHVGVTVSYTDHGSTRTVQADALITTPLNYYSAQMAYLAVYGGPDSAGEPVWIHGLTAGGQYPTAPNANYVTRFDNHGCAFFVNVPGSAPNTAPADQYFVFDNGVTSMGGYGAAAEVTACMGQTSDVNLYSQTIMQVGGGFGGCGAVSPTQAAVPKISVTPSSLSFQVIGINHWTASQTVTVQNVGAWPLQLNGISITGTNPANFNITSATCTAGMQLAAGTPGNPGQSCTIAIAFEGTDPNQSHTDYSAVLSIASDAVNNPDAQVSLSGQVLFCNGLSAPAPRAQYAVAPRLTCPVIPVLEQNLNGAGQIKVALPNGPETELINGPWFWANGWVNVFSVGGPGEFTGVMGQGFHCCWAWTDFFIEVTLDGQTVLYSWASWGGNWLSNGAIMGGAYNNPCPGCTMYHFFPPGGITFNQSMQVNLYGCCGGNYYWVSVFWNRASQPY